MRDDDSTIQLRRRSARRLDSKCPVALASASMLAPTILMNDGKMTLATLGPLCMYLYVDTMTSAHIARGGKLHRTHHKLHPEGLGILLIYRARSYIRADTDPRAFNDLAALIRETGDYVKAAAIVIEEKGFSGAAIRMAGTSVTLLAHPRFALSE